MSVRERLARAGSAVALLEGQGRRRSVHLYHRLLLGPAPDMIEGLEDSQLLAPERSRLKTVIKRMLAQEPRGRLSAWMVRGLGELEIALRRAAGLDFRSAVGLGLWAQVFVGLAGALVNCADVCTASAPLTLTWRLPDGTHAAQVLSAGDALICLPGRRILRRWISGRGYAYADFDSHAPG